MQIEPLDNARDLFAKLLVDVNMGSEAKTSKVKEAISAIQLYLHRYFVNLESVDLKAPGDREDLKRWWTWMRNYRVWEANRKVFLYPENYIRPELRDTKSPIFKKLEEALMQGEITDELVTGAFYNYLEEFAKVGNLKITGANVHDEGDDQVLVLFGHTRTEPVQYYYQTSQFLKSGDVIWGNWLPVDISINSTRVFPIYAFGRILLFWIEIHAQEESVPYGRNQGTPAKRESATKVDTSDTVLKYRASVKYSFYGFNRQWVHPQTLQEGIELNYQVDAAYVAGKDSLVLFSGEYCLTTTPNNPQGDIKKKLSKFTTSHRSLIRTCKTVLMRPLTMARIGWFSSRKINVRSVNFPLIATPKPLPGMSNPLQKSLRTLTGNRWKRRISTHRSFGTISMISKTMTILTASLQPFMRVLKTTQFV